MELILIIMISLVSNIIYWQTISMLSKRSRNLSALTMVYQLLAGITIFIFIPFEEMKFCLDWRIWLCLLLACMFYATNDRLMAVVFQKLNTVEVSLLKQTYLVFLLIIGLVFFKEAFVLTKVLSAIIVIICNVILLYDNKISLNNEKWKYVGFGILASLCMAIAMAIDIDISEHFNLAIYAALSLILPSICIGVADRKKVTLRKVMIEIAIGKKYLFIAAASLGLQIYTVLKAYTMGSVLTVAPLLSLAIFLNVCYEFFFLKNRTRVWQKFVASLLVILAIVLLNMN